jgi:hypothetical protein
MLAQQRKFHTVFRFPPGKSVFAINSLDRSACANTCDGGRDEVERSADFGVRGRMLSDRFKISRGARPMTGSGDDDTKSRKKQPRRTRAPAGKRGVRTSLRGRPAEKAASRGALAVISQLESFRLSVEEMLASHIADKSLRRALSVVASHNARKLLLPERKTSASTSESEAGEASGRVRSTDATDGFKARQRAHRALFMQHKGDRPGILGPDYYTPRDFLNEEWGDMIAKGHLTKSILIKDDYILYRLLMDYIRGLRKGSYSRPCEPDASLDDLLKYPRASVRLQFDRSAAE